MFEDIDGEAAVEACKAAVEAYPDVARFRYQLARAYDARYGSSAAIPYYEKAAVNGHRQSVRVLYWIYLDEFEQSGDTDEESRRDAAKWLLHGAEVQQDPDMRVELGIALYEGILLPPDRETALQTFRTLAADGHPHAQYLLGTINLYDAGYDQEQIDLAFGWLERASLNGSEDATDFVLHYYRYALFFGTIPKLSEEEAEYFTSKGDDPIHTYGRTPEHVIAYLEGAARVDYVWANVVLSHQYRFGKYVAKDLQKARILMQRAVDLGDDMASYYLEDILEAIEQEQ